MPVPAPALWIHDPRRRWPSLVGGPLESADARLVDAAEGDMLRRLAADDADAPLLALAEDEDAALAALALGADGALTRDDLAAGRLEQQVARARVTRVAARAEVQRRVAEIGAARATLESFGRSVSHDLRAPLRAIDGFGQALLEDYADALDPLAVRYVQRIRAGAERLGDRLTALLRLTEMVRRPLIRRAVDLGPLADEIVEELRRSDPARVVHWRRGDGLMAIGDPHLLQRLLGELLHNAWRFTGPRSEAHVELWRRGPGFVVRDDGVGFGQSFGEKIFDAFTRFHTEDEFPGAGVGLAVARCAVERHGGRITALGEEDVGAAFGFTLQPDSGPLSLSVRDLAPGDR